MKITLNRIFSGQNSTIGTIEVNGFKCFTCEDEKRDKKVAGETRIPAGEYEIKLRNEGGMNDQYSKKYDFHKHGMLWLQNVKDFEYVYIHVGNTEKDTLGCILVGLGVNLVPGGGTIARSGEAYRQIYPLITDAILKGEKVTISVS